MATNMLLNAEQVASMIDAQVPPDPGLKFTKASRAPSSPRPGDQWLNTTGGNAAAYWPLRTYVDGRWIDTRRFDPSTKKFLDETPDQEPTIVNVAEITKSTNQPTSPQEGNIWWQPAGSQLIQHVFFDGAWQLTGASYNTQSRRYVPITIGDGLEYRADGVMATVASGGGTGFAAGDIVISLDDPLPATLIELNGTIYTNGTTRYPGICARYPWMVIGQSLHLPNFRGTVPRHLDPTSVFDPGATSRTARAGDRLDGAVVGSYQSDCVGEHNHQVMSNWIQRVVLGRPPNAVLVSQYNDYGLPKLLDEAKTMLSGEAETRMKNIAVRYCLVAG